MRTTIPSFPSGDAVGSLLVSVVGDRGRMGVHSRGNVYVETWFFWHGLSAEDIVERVFVVLSLKVRSVREEKERRLTRKIL